MRTDRAQSVLKSVIGVLDFVTGWYSLAAEYMRCPKSIRCAFVSTNSICQGEQASVMWSKIIGGLGGHKIHFAHRTFSWDSEARGKAHVHCVIVGFGPGDDGGTRLKRIYDYENDPDNPTITVVSNISPYLVEGVDMVVSSRSRPLCEVPGMIYGSKPTDGGHLIIDDSDYRSFVDNNSACAKYVRPFRGSEEFINGKNRWCLWLKNAEPTDIRSCPDVLSRIAAVKSFREQSTKEATRKDANVPSLFAEPRQPCSDYLLVPSVSSERRRYIPIGFMPKEVIASNLVFVIPDANEWLLGVLSSEMHMAWTRLTCGRLKSDFRYSNKLVYNNFPWPTDTTEAQRAKVEECAREVLAAREQFPGSTLADLYDPVSMPPRLAKAHEQLDRAVDRCYRKDPFTTDRQRVEYLFGLYEKLSAPLAPTKKPAKKRTKKS